MCDICEVSFGHLEGCPLDYGDPYENCGLYCSLCGEEISDGQNYIYDPDGDGEGIVCSECIEAFSVSDILEVCGVSSVAEIISVLAGKVMKAGDRY